MRFLKAISRRWKKTSTRGKIGIVLLAAAMVVFVTAYFEPHKLWIDQEINEDFPLPVAAVETTTSTTTTAAPVTDAPATPNTTAPPIPPTTTLPDNPPPDDEPEEPTPDDSQTTTSVVAEETTTTVTTTTTTAAPVTTTTTEAVPEGPVLVSSSDWISLGHPGTGTVLVYQQPDESHVIRFENLDVSNGPDLLVILSTSPLVDDQNTYSEVEYVSLGDLKGNKGNQNYEVPAEVNLADYQTVAIWCRRFDYTFNAAQLHSPPT